ncbi:MAG: DUF4912 domain-containing protein, partial [Candidatus Margulisbacteria bacterium]|nr:DUF4912 domain-containing protein [Candidatus Margulisiibacteriota bacterium]
MPRKKKVITATTIITRKKTARKKSPAKKLNALAAARPKKKPRTKKIKPPIIPSGPKVEEAKYYTGPVMRKFETEREFELPASYGDNRIVAMVRDPYWFFAYWEVSSRRRDEIGQMVGGDLFSRSKEVLRVYDTENWNYFDIQLTAGSASWYIKVPAPNRTYCVDIGFLLPDGRFIAAARSNWITMPLDRMSDLIDEEWMIPDWEKIYSLSGGFGIGKGSQEIRELVKKRFLEESGSGWVSSGSARAS